MLISVLKLVAETHVDDLPTVVDTLIENYEEEVIPIAYEVTVELVSQTYSIYSRVKRDSCILFVQYF